eukprot:362289-Chlamydomonas_euryale.AAC.3
MRTGCGEGVGSATACSDGLFRSGMLDGEDVRDGCEGAGVRVECGAGVSSASACSHGCSLLRKSMLACAGVRGACEGG